MIKRLKGSLAILPLIILFSGSMSEVHGKIQILISSDNPADAGKILDMLETIASDYNLDTAQTSPGSGIYEVTMGDKKHDGPETEAKGDSLIRAAINSNSDITITYIPGRGLHTFPLKPMIFNGEELVEDEEEGKGYDSALMFGMELNDDSILVDGGEDEDGNPVWVKNPLYIALAHELIHAVHIENGTIDKEDPEGQAIDEDKKGGHGITENDIRGEHGEPERKGHAGIDTGK